MVKLLKTIFTRFPCFAEERVDRPPPATIPEVEIPHLELFNNGDL